MERIFVVLTRAESKITPRFTAAFKTRDLAVASILETTSEIRGRWEVPNEAYIDVWRNHYLIVECDLHDEVTHL